MPQYLEAHVQLIGCMRKMGKLELAIAQGIESSKNFGQGTVIQSLLGRLYLETGDYQRSKEYLYSVVKGGHPNDVLALVLIGMLNLKTMPKDLRYKAHRDKAKDHLLKALENFRAALTNDPHCFYAAHGASAVIGEFGRCTEISKLYEQIVEITSKKHWASHPQSIINPHFLPSAEINLGHLWFCKKQFSHAIHLYRYASYLQKSSGHADASILNLIARAQYESRSKFDEAVHVLSQLTHLKPWDKSVTFNLALVLQGGPVYFFTKFKIPAAPSDDGIVRELRSAAQKLDRALGLYHGMLALPEDRLPVTHQVIEEQIKMCLAHKRRAEEAEQTVTKLLEKQAIQDRIYKKEWQAHLQKQAEEKRLREEAEMKLEAELAERRSMFIQEREARNAERIDRPTEPSPKRKRRREKRDNRARTFMDISGGFGLAEERALADEGDGLQDAELEDDVELDERESREKIRKTILSDDSDL